MKKISCSGAGRKERRAVGGIIAGVILAAILVTTVLVYFVSILNNEKARTAYEFRAEQENTDKKTESYKALRSDTISGGSLFIAVENDGPLTMNVSRALVYCIDCAEPAAPIDNDGLAFVLSPGEFLNQTYGDGLLQNNKKYRVDIISERGNIVSSEVCLVEGAICSDDGGDTEVPPEVTGAITEGIIQGTGSIQLDFKAFGAIYPQLLPRDGVDQRGWDVKVSSKYGSATGYPGFDLQSVTSGGSNSGTNAILVEKARNLDPSGDDMVFTRNTGLMTANDQVQGTPPKSNYLCKEDKQNKQVLAYNEQANNKTLPSTPTNAALTEGWHEMFFCSTAPGSNSPSWTPANKFSNLNGLFLIARATFEESHAPYAQTIPYQAISIGKGSVNSESVLNACLRSEARTESCPAPTAPDTMDTTGKLQYSALRGDMIDANGVTVFLHLDPAVTLPNYDVSWLYPDGNYTRIVDGAASLLPGSNLQLDLPRFESDGTTLIDCSGGPGTSEYYTLIFTDGYDGAGKRYIYYMTWRMDC